MEATLLLLLRLCLLLFGLQVVLSGLSNTYSSYITTYEEYQVQRYEGASTAYGPHTLDAYIQTAVKMVKVTQQWQLWHWLYLGTSLPQSL